MLHDTFDVTPDGQLVRRSHPRECCCNACDPAYPPTHGVVDFDIDGRPIFADQNRGVQVDPSFYEAGGNPYLLVGGEPQPTIYDDGPSPEVGEDDEGEAVDLMDIPF